MINKNNSETITFTLGGMVFEYDEWKRVTDVLFMVYTERVQILSVP